jgi:DNA-directed RNA polymerase subunit RPC12/RpoP
MSDGIAPQGAGEAIGANAIVSEELQCPTCGSRRLRRLERKGFLQNKVYSFFGYYPWRCGACKASFYMKRRSFIKGTKEKKYVK